MKLALLTDGIPPFVMGGMQKHSYFLAKYLAQNGIEIELHTMVDDQTPEDAELPFTPEELENIEVHFHRFPGSWKFPGHYMFSSYLLSKKMYEAMEHKLSTFDFIYTKGFTGWRLLQQVSRLPDRPPIGVKLHGMNMFLPTSGLKQKLEQYLLRPVANMVMRKSDVVFSYGGKVTDTIQQTGVPRSKVIEIPTGIEQAWQRQGIKNSLQERVFLFVGRYDPVKGIRELNQAIAQNEFLNASFHFVGPFPESVRLSHPSVVYHGQIQSASKMKELMDNADVLMLPSYSEGMPNVVLEAMARGMAIMATDVGAVGALVDDTNGLLINSSSSKDIATGIRDMLDLSNEQLDNLKHNSLKRIREEFLWEKISLKCIEQINAILECFGDR